MMASVARSLAALRRGPVRLFLITSLTVFSVLTGTIMAWAYWTTGSSVSGAASAATLQLTTTNFTSLAYTFQNHALTTTGSVTATNTTQTASTQVQTVTLAFTPQTTAMLASYVNLTIWPSSNSYPCTTASAVPSGATSGTWTSGPSVSTTLAPNSVGTATYCLRSTLTSTYGAGIAGGSQSFTPLITGTISIGNWSGGTTVTTSESTAYIYPTATLTTGKWFIMRPNLSAGNIGTYCVDVQYGGPSASGTQVISYGCPQVSGINEQWMFTQVGSTPYYTFDPKNSQTLNADNNSWTVSGTGITVNTAVSAATNQQWQPQIISTTSTATYLQFVNAYSGMCLTSPTGSAQNLGQMYQAPCNASAAQQIILTQIVTNPGCTTSGTNFAFAWTAAAVGPYSIQASSNGTTWTTVGTTTTATPTGLTVAMSSVYSAAGATGNVRMIDASGTNLAFGTFTVTSVVGTAITGTCSLSNVT